MRDPQAALEAARRAAASAPQSEDETWVDHELQAPHQIRRLAEWAIIAPDEREVYSTRRLGQPITGVKRLLIRLLRQYIDQLGSQQSRFNAQLAAHLIGIEERVRQLEGEVDALRNARGDTAHAPPHADGDTPPVPPHDDGDTPHAPPHADGDTPPE